MAEQLDLLKEAANKPIFETLDLAEFDSSIQGQIRFRVNPTRKMWTEITEAFTAEDNEALIRLTAGLLPRGDADDTPLTAEEFKVFLENDPDADPLFTFWFTRRLYQRITKHFLAVTQSATVSIPG